MAGLLSGAIAGAISGGGQAIQHNAQSQIEQKRQAALEKLRHGNAMKRQGDQQQFQSGEREAGQEFQAEQKGIDRDQNLTLAEMREQGADQRSGAQISSADRRAEMGQLQRGVDGDGNTAWFNPATGQRVDAPDGWSPGQEGPDARGDDWSRQRYEIQWLQDEIEGIEERIAMDSGLAPSERQALRDDLRLKQRDLERLRGHSIGRTSAGPRDSSASGGDDAVLSLDAFMGR